MITRWRLRTGLLCLMWLSGSLPAQSARQPQRGGPPPGPQLGGQPQAQGFGARFPQGAFGGARVLKSRDLENHELEEKDLKKYESLIGSMEKRAAAAPTSGQSNRVTELSATFRLATTHLRHAQEQAAMEAFLKAWQLVPDMYKEPRSMAAATGQVRTHLRELQTLAMSDPELVLTFMCELSDAHQRAYEAIEQEKAKGQLSQPLAQTWVLLTEAGQLDKEALKRASAWILLNPQMAMVDRALSPEASANYQSELTQLTIDVGTRLRHLAERQLGRATGRPVHALNPNEAQEADPATAQLLSILDAKRGPMMRFLEADTHFKFGQSRAGLAATQIAWRELLEFYRSNPGTVSPVDAGAHFETVDRTAELNPIQAAVVVDQVDQAYRTMLQVDRMFGARLADLWARNAMDLVLPVPMLAKAAFWLEHVSKHHKDLENKYAAALEEIKSKLPADQAERETRPPGRARAAQEPQDAQEDDRAPNRTRRGVTVPQGVDHLREANQ